MRIRKDISKNDYIALSHKGGDATQNHTPYELHMTRDYTGFRSGTIQYLDKTLVANSYINHIKNAENLNLKIPRFDKGIRIMSYNVHEFRDIDGFLVLIK